MPNTWASILAAMAVLGTIAVAIATFLQVHYP